MNSTFPWITGNRTVAALLALALAVVAFIGTALVAPGPLSDSVLERRAAGPGTAGVPGVRQGPAGSGGLGTGPAPSAAPGKTATTTSCVLTTKLVPTCGMLWGVAPSALTDEPAGTALHQFESTTGRPADILHAYHRGDEVFPTADERAAVDGAQKRLLFVNWKVAWGSTWADVAAGAEDARIDRAAARLRSFPGKLFLALHHEPENDVRAGGGMTAADFRAMYRHTVLRLRAEGVTNVVFVMVYMAYEPWCVQPWFSQLWPGDDVVDWVGFDPYLFAKPDTYGHGDFSYLVDHTSDPGRWPGFYTWVTRNHGNKPLMIAEWGVYEYSADPDQKAYIFSTVMSQIHEYPAIRAMVYFDSPDAPKGDTRPDSSKAALTQFKALADSTLFGVKL
jgi:hypothetical protein